MGDAGEGTAAKKPKLSKGFRRHGRIEEVVVDVTGRDGVVVQKAKKIKHPALDDDGNVARCSMCTDTNHLFNNYIYHEDPFCEACVSLIRKHFKQDNLLKKSVNCVGTCFEPVQSKPDFR